MISVSCSGCKKAYQLNDRFAGKTVRCKACGKSFIAPNPDVDLDEIFPSMEEIEPPPAPTRAASVIKRPNKTTAVIPPDPELPERPSSIEHDFEYEESESESDDFDFESETSESNQDVDPNVEYSNFQSEGMTVGRSIVPRKKGAGKKRVKKPPRLRSRIASMVSDEPGKTIVWGSIAGLLGAICWGAIAYYANREISYVAWAIGWIVGNAVRMTSDELEDRTAGFIAALISVGAIICGKFLAAMAIALDEGLRDFDWSLVGMGFLATFGALDLLFFIFAVCTAYYVASRSERS